MMGWKFHRLSQFLQEAMAIQGISGLRLTSSPQSFHPPSVLKIFHSLFTLFAPFWLFLFLLSLFQTLKLSFSSAACSPHYFFICSTCFKVWFSSWNGLSADHFAASHIFSILSPITSLLHFGTYLQDRRILVFWWTQGTTPLGRDCHSALMPCPFL